MMADKGLRIGNFAVDLLAALAVYYLMAALSIKIFPEIFTTQNRVEALFYLTYFLYYLISESLFGNTIGKRLTKTIVVDKHGNKPSFIKILMRSLFRFFPLDTFSFLIGSSGFHDTISGTRVVLKNNNNKL